MDSATNSIIRFKDQIRIIKRFKLIIAYCKDKTSTWILQQILSLDSKIGSELLGKI